MWLRSSWKNILATKSQLYKQSCHVILFTQWFLFYIFPTFQSCDRTLQAASVVLSSVLFAYCGAIGSVGRGAGWCDSRWQLRRRAAGTGLSCWDVIESCRSQRVL